MIKNLFWFAALVILCDNSVFPEIVIPIIHYSITRRKGTYITTPCILPDNAIDDYYKVRDFIYTFLDTAETDFRKLNNQEKALSCYSAKENLTEIIVKGKADWANCLRDNFAFFGDFVNDTLQNFVDFFCESGNGHIEGYFAEESKQCRANIKKPLLDNCITILSTEKLNYDLSFRSFLFPEKRDELCRNLLDIGTCTTDLLKIHCPYFNDYQQLSGKLFAQTIKTCDEYSYILAAKIVGITLISISFVIIVVVRFCPVRRWYADCRQRVASKPLLKSVI